MPIAEIIHLSDLHFGPKNITNIIGPTTKRRSLAELLLRDLKQPYPSIPEVRNGKIVGEVPVYQRVVCVTGDFAVSGSSEELKLARNFLNELAKGLEWPLEEARRRIVLIPGNHDLEWSKSDAELRWQTWRIFFDDFYGTKSDSDSEFLSVRLVRIEDANVAVLCLDSEHHIHSKSDYKHCGIIDETQIERVEELLNASSTDNWFKQAIKVCIVHHHPILIPSLVELGRGAGQVGDEPGYDAVFNAQRVLNLLHKHRFQLVLHGHKHIPHVFTEDIVNACHRAEDHSMVIVAGGTVGADDPVPIDGWRQCYNRILVHWNLQRQSTRTEVTTRGLCRTDAETGQELLWKNWRWMTMRTVDRFSSVWGTVPNLKLDKQQPELPYAAESDQEKIRGDEYKRLRGNMPAFEMRPSLIPGQEYEVRFWITRHNSPNFQQTANDLPDKVVWSAGRLFPRVTIDRTDDDAFCGVYHCYAAMLLQAEMFFPDHYTATAHIYARLPENKV